MNGENGFLNGAIIGMRMLDAASGLIYKVENAASFDVLENDVYGTGFRVTSYLGVFYVDGSWELRNAGPA